LFSAAPFQVRVRTPLEHEVKFVEDPSGYETGFTKDPPEVP
jgi:hypothetical protein